MVDNKLAQHNFLANEGTPIIPEEKGIWATIHDTLKDFFWPTAGVEKKIVEQGEGFQKARKAIEEEYITGDLEKMNLDKNTPTGRMNADKFVAGTKAAKNIAIEGGKTAATQVITKGIDIPDVVPIDNAVEEFIVEKTVDKAVSTTVDKTVDKVVSDKPKTVPKKE
jgi:hypothetical protein